MTTNRPCISVVVPVYNAERYLRDALLSVQRQTFTDWECIIVDDESPDNSYKIAEEFVAMDSRFRLIRQANAGGAAARNTGHNAAQGEWLMFLDNDDYYHPQIMELFLTFSKKYPDADMIDATFKHVDAEWTPAHDPSCVSSISLELPPSKYFSHDKLLQCLSCFSRQYFGVVWNAMYRKSAIANLRHKTTGVADMDFRFNVVSRTRGYVQIYMPLYFYRNTPGSETNMPYKTRQWMEIAISLVEILETCVNENHLSGRFTRQFHKCMSTRVKMYYYGTLRRKQISADDVAAILKALHYLEAHQFPLYQTIPIIRRFQFWLFVKTGKFILLRRNNLT